MPEFEVTLKLRDLHKIKDSLQEHGKLIGMLKINTLIKDNLYQTLNSIRQVLEKAKLKEVKQDGKVT